ncbi:MAG: hypothetical protein AAGA48_16560 [Myxococcota bacterium]
MSWMLLLSTIIGSDAYANGTVVPEVLNYNGRWYIKDGDSSPLGPNTITTYRGADGTITLNQNGNDGHVASHNDGDQITNVTDDIEDAPRDDPNGDNSIPNGDDPPQV